MFTKVFRSRLLAVSVVLFAASAQVSVVSAQAQALSAGPSSFQLAQTTTTTTPEGSTTRTETIPASPAATAPPATAPPVSQPADTSTKVEIHNEVPAANQPATAPDINIEMPKAPDINVTMPDNNSGTTNTVTERTDRVIMTGNDQAENSNFTLLAMLFGLFAIAMVGIGIYMASRRRNEVV